ncbi:MAG: hypothetical protein ACYCZU_14840, partial [Devosia sp.]
LLARGGGRGAERDDGDAGIKSEFHGVSFRREWVQGPDGGTGFAPAAVDAAHPIDHLLLVL